MCKKKRPQLHIGITGISKETIEQLEENWEQIPKDIILDKMAILLTTMGRGDLNLDTGEWKPSSSEVYSFDLECYEIEEMYTNFFNGITTIGKEELKFTRN